VSDRVDGAAAAACELLLVGCPGGMGGPECEAWFGICGRSWREEGREGVRVGCGPGNEAAGEFFVDVAVEVVVNVYARE
jgi:hypothetical protein